MKIDKPDHQWWRAIDESVGSLLDSRHWQFRSFPKETSLWPTRYLSKIKFKINILHTTLRIYKTNLCIFANISHGHGHFGAGSKGICSTDVLFFQYIPPPTTKLSRFRTITFMYC